MCKLFSKWLVLTIISLFVVEDSLADQRYRVASGDNLYRIGKRFGIDYREIMSANRLRKTTIYPNQVLIIPSQQSESTQIAKTTPPRVPSAVASNSRIGNPGTFRSSTIPKDPVEPFVSARKLPSAPPIISEEDPLGLGYDPSPSPYVNPPAKQARPAPIQRAQTPITPRVPEIAEAPKIRSFPRSREVPAVAHYPGRPKAGDYALDPKQFPMPSFKNPCKPCPSKSSRHSSGSRSYTVQSGDSVWSISRKFGVAPLKLRQENKIMFSRIKPGMNLQIPSSHGIWSL